MSQNETDAHPAGSSPKDNLRKLAVQAREAYEEKRTKDCLDLARSILLIDPEHATAKWLVSSLEPETRSDVKKASALLRAPKTKSNAQNHTESGESRAVPSDWRETLRTHWLVLASTFIVLGCGIGGSYFYLSKPSTVDASRIASLSDPLIPSEATNAATPVPLPGAFQQASPPPASQPAAFGAETSPVVNRPPSIPAKRLVPDPPAHNALVSRAAVPSVASPAPPPKSPNPPAAARANGTLAVSSTASVDIYKDGAYVGSAPISLELPAGMQTLEYRHGNLSKKVTHAIESNETTRATITFDVEVQINSRPWAEVFVDGVERKDLGQTPLSGVRVPIGSVLAFENPGFPTKKYRVNGNETGIQNVFP